MSDKKLRPPISLRGPVDQRGPARPTAAIGDCSRGGWRGLIWPNLTSARMDELRTVAQRALSCFRGFTMMPMHVGRAGVRGRVVEGNLP